MLTLAPSIRTFQYSFADVGIRRQVEGHAVAQMNPISRMRQVGDLLLSEGRVAEAYTVYDELYRQMWGVFGTVQASLTGTAFGSAFGSSRGNTDGRDTYAEPVASVLCARLYGATLSSVLEEFQQVLHGHLQCICSSRDLSKQASSDTVLNEFAVFFILALQRTRVRKITPVFAVVTAVVDKDHKFRRLRPNCLRREVEKRLVEAAEESRNTEWKSVNNLLLNYLDLTSQSSSDLYTRVLRITGPRWDRSYKRSQTQDRQESRSNNRRNEKAFDASTASEAEKKLHYGKLFGLKGVITKSEIRSRYISTVALYHPDKVQHLGKELQDFAEEKTKELNAAYDWLKARYDIK